MSWSLESVFLLGRVSGLALMDGQFEEIMEGLVYMDIYSSLVAMGYTFSWFESIQVISKMTLSFLVQIDDIL